MYLLRASFSRVYSKDWKLLSASEYLPHDAYILFDKVMNTTGEWFHTKPAKIKDEDAWVSPEDQVHRF